jgi:protein-S-isoprenylcysteine O-methyltransferase Ste14
MSAVASPRPAASPRLAARVLIGLAALAIIWCAALFGSAGTLDWPMGWVYIVIYIGLALLGRLIGLRATPDLIEERSASLGKAGAQSGDKLLVILVALVGPFLMVVVSGLNYRNGWPPPVAPWLQWTAAAAMLLGFGFSTWAMLVNRFFSAVVRIQTDRGHIVVSDGPYRIVRHPGYAGGAAGYAASALALGSVWALLPAALIVAAIAIRTAREDRKLQAELPGYLEYAGRVRYRLLPGVW